VGSWIDGLPAKRSFDLLVSFLLLVASLPVAAAVAAAIRWTMGRPVLFHQPRGGRDGQPFVLWKFRTMRERGGGEHEYASDGDRLTKLGHVLRSSSLDELPNLVNVLRGDMSLVGPRPLPVAYLDRYSPEQARRNDVRPGITGWAQVNGRNSLSWEEKFDLDVWYVDHRSFALDLRILWQTVHRVARRADISSDGTATMHEFLGSGQPSPD
jgi:sugar transferase EpsL